MIIGIIGAMEVEVATIKSHMSVERRLTRARMEFDAGTLGGAKVVVVSGVGKVNAAVCAQILVDEFEVTHVINTGVAGSLDARIDIGDVVVSTDVCHHDVDATIFGYAPGEIPQLGTKAFPADEVMREAALAAVESSACDIKAFEGRVVSGDQFIANDEAKSRLADDFGGMCCEMEGAAIAQTCWLNHVPFVIVRAISDKADGSKHMLYPVFEEKAAKHCAAIVERMVEQL